MTELMYVNCHRRARKQTIRIAKRPDATTVIKKKNIVLVVYAQTNVII